MPAYTGALARAAYYSQEVPPAGATPDHGLAVSGDDVFTPPLQQDPHAGTVWSADEDPAPMGDGPSLPVSHTGVRAVPLPMGTPEPRQAFADAMTAAHSDVQYISDARPVFHSAGQSVTFEKSPDEGSGASGITGPDWFMVGRNGYDVSNPVNSMNDVTGGRYRLGARTTIYGEYDQHGKYGFDPELRATQFRAPYLPQDTPPVPNPVGRTKSSSGTAQWLTPLFNVPQLFATPAPEAATDVAVEDAAPYADYGTGTGEFQ